LRVNGSVKETLNSSESEPPKINVGNVSVFGNPAMYGFVVGLAVSCLAKENNI